MKAIFINGSPRKKGNTAELLSKTMQGASDAGCETKMIHLRDLKFTGCISCLACKIKGSKCAGLCAIRDDLRPVLEETLASDILVIGTPVYFHYPTALTRAFMERLLFAPLDYVNAGSSVLTKKIRCATIYTMHVMNDELFEKMDYAQTLGVAAKSLELLGPQEVLYFRGLSVFSGLRALSFPSRVRRHSQQDARGTLSGIRAPGIRIGAAAGSRKIR